MQPIYTALYKSTQHVLFIIVITVKLLQKKILITVYNSCHISIRIVLLKKFCTIEIF